MQKKSNRKHYVLYIVSILTLLSITHNTYALDHQNSTNIQFAFNPTISISISGNLTIDNLSPGTAKDSNIVDVNVATNNVSGYSLSATVGNTSSSTTNLINVNNSDYKFSSIVSDVSDLSNFSPNTWGYSYSANNVTTWRNYSSLPLYNTTGTTLSEKYNASNDIIKFKIGARADTTQASGTYTNTINFYAIAHDSPKTFQEAYIAEGKQLYNGYYTMQDMTSTICDAVDVDTNIQLIDVRDNQLYTVAKLKDNKCWMTSNLNIAGGTALYSSTSDIPSGYENTPYYILPASAIKNSDNANLTDNAQFSDNNGQYVFNSGNMTNDESDCNSANPCNSYYSWLVSTVGGKNNSGTNVTGDGYNAAYSICPRSWRLPTATTEGVPRDDNGYTGGEFYQMLNRYGLDTGTYYANKNTVPNSTTVFNNISANTTPNFLRTGRYDYGTFYDGGNNGTYWSSTSYTYAGAYNFGFYSTEVVSAYPNGRRLGFSVRCLAK